MKINFTVVDQYGQRHACETRELINFKLVELEQELDKLDQVKLDCFRQAQDRCPALVDDEFLLMFLRCESFDSCAAAKRLAKYWTTRVNIFGADKAYLPLTQEEALNEDNFSMRSGLTQLVGTRDPSGRGLIFYNLSKLPTEDSRYDPTSILRAVWYFVHAALEDEEAQKKGLLFLVSLRNTRLAHIDFHLEQMLLDSIRGCLPIRISAIHLCFTPWFFASVWSVLKFMMGYRVRKRVIIHGGCGDMLSKLQKFGLAKSVLPTEMGGYVELDVNRWIDGRWKVGK